MKEKKVTIQTLAREINDLLELGIPAGKNIKCSKAAKIVNAILKAMKDALMRGERVRVDGFGIFEAKPARTEYVVYFYPYLKKKGLPTGRISLKPRKRVYFRPSKMLKRMVNVSSS